MDKTFEYGGKHFIPERKFNSTDGDFFKITHCLKSNNSLGFQTADYYNGTQKFNYNYDDFYNNSTEKNYDIFRCVETNKLYIPCKGELMQYEPKKQKKREFER